MDLLSTVIPTTFGYFFNWNWHVFLFDFTPNSCITDLNHVELFWFETFCSLFLTLHLFFSHCCFSIKSYAVETHDANKGLSPIALLRLIADCEDYSKSKYDRDDLRKFLREICTEGSMYIAMFEFIMIILFVIKYTVKTYSKISLLRNHFFKRAVWFLVSRLIFQLHSCLVS